MRALDAEVLIVAPDGMAFGVPGLVDAQGALRRCYFDRLERADAGGVLLFVLNLHGAPVAAWAGAEAEPDSLPGEAVEWLDFISIQCPK